MNWRKLIPHVVALFYFYAFAYILFPAPEWNGLAGEEAFLDQHDIMQSYASTEELRQHREAADEEALWMNNMFSGMPAFLNGVQYPPEILTNVYQVMTPGLWRVPGIIFISAICFYIMLLVFGIKDWIAGAGAMMFSVSGYMIFGLLAGHNARIEAVAFIPLFLAGLRLTFSNRLYLGLGLSGLAFAFQVRAGHPQITYYLLLIVVIFGISELVNYYQRGETISYFKRIGFLVIVVLLGIGANAGDLYHTIAYGKYSTRGSSEIESSQESGLSSDYVFSYSNGITEPLVMLFPHYLGGASQEHFSNDSEIVSYLADQGVAVGQIEGFINGLPTYWGTQPLSAPYYVGNTLLLLIVMAFVVLPRRKYLWILAFVLFGIVVSWGSNFSVFNDFLFNHFPGFNKFRSVTFAMLMPVIGVILLGYLGLNRWLEEDDTEQRKKWLIKSALISLGIIALLLLVGEFRSYRSPIDANFPDWIIPSLLDSRKELFREEVLWSLLVLAEFVLLLWIELPKVKRKTFYRVAALGLFVGTVVGDSYDTAVSYVYLSEYKYGTPEMLERLEYDKTFWTDRSVQDQLVASEADVFISSESNPGERVLNLLNPWNDAQTSFFHESIGGYHGAKMRRYQDVIDQHLFQESNEAITVLQAGSGDFSGLGVLNMLNTRFLKAGDQRGAVFLNEHANGSAWFVSSVKEVNSPLEAIQTIGTVDLKQTAVLNTSEFQTAQAGGNGDILLSEKTPNRLVYNINNSGQSGLVVFSEIFYPDGWKAYLDGTEVDILRANYLLRALEIPTGDHEIVFEYAPASYAKMSVIMMICSSLILLLFVAGVVMDIKATR